MEMCGGGEGGETSPIRICIFMNYLCRMEASSAQSNMFLFSSRYLPYGPHYDRFSDFVKMWLQNRLGAI